MRHANLCTRLFPTAILVLASAYPAAAHAVCDNLAAAFEPLEQAKTNADAGAELEALEYARTRMVECLSENPNEEVTKLARAWLTAIDTRLSALKAPPVAPAEQESATPAELPPVVEAPPSETNAGISESPSEPASTSTQRTAPPLRVDPTPNNATTGPWRAVGLSLGIAGAGVTGAGVVFAVAAASDANTALDDLRVAPDAKAWDTAKVRYDDAKSDNTVALWTVAGGAVAALAGAWLTYEFWPRQADTAISATIGYTPRVNGIVFDAAW